MEGLVLAYMLLGAMTWVAVVPRSSLTSFGRLAIIAIAVYSAACIMAWPLFWAWWLWRAIR